MDYKNNSVASNRYLCFSLGEQEYAVQLTYVREVIELPDITPVPQSPSHFRGIMNLRGQILSIVDIRLKLLGTKQEATPGSAVIILDFESFFVGVVVSSVNRVLPFEKEEIKEAPKMENSRGDFVNGIVQKDKKLILVLDVARTLNIEDLKNIKNNTYGPTAA